MIGTIRGRRTFQTLARSGRKAKTRTLWCTYLDDPTAVPLRVAFAVGRIVGPATTRNRLRRQLREIVATSAAQAELSRGLLLIGATPAATKHTFDELSAQVRQLLAEVARPQ